MPEGPETYNAAKVLNKLFKNWKLTEIEVNEKSRYYQLKEFDIEIASVREIYSRSKKIVFVMESESGVYYLVFHYAMEGKLVLSPLKHSGLKLTFVKDEEEKKLYFDDTRHFGSLKIAMNEEELAEIFKNFGPDLLTEDVSEEDFLKVLNNKKLEEKQIVWFLLQPKFFSGIGNYLKSEILYCARIRPDRKIKELTLIEKRRIFSCINLTIKESVVKGGLTIKSFLSPFGEMGGYIQKVYGRKKDDFGNEVRKDVFTDKRSTFWVPALQN